MEGAKFNQIPSQESEPSLMERIESIKNKREQILGLCAKIEVKPDCLKMFTIDDPLFSEIRTAHSELLSHVAELENLKSLDLYVRGSILQDMVLVDAGFIDEGYLAEVLSDLSRDLEIPTKIENNPVRLKTRKIVVDAMKRVEMLISGKTTNDTSGVDYGLDDISEFEESIDEDPLVDLVQELTSANTKAAEADPNYKNNEDRGAKLVWSFLSDEAKRLWNYQIWNKDFLTNPDAIAQWLKLRPERVGVRVPKDKKINIKKPK
jgi:hypothetical protein